MAPRGAALVTSPGRSLLYATGGGAFLHSRVELGGTGILGPYGRSSTVRDWRGLYVGVNVGGGQSLVHTKQTGAFPGETDINGTGFAAGGQVGYNFTGVLMPKFFAGVEGDIGSLRVRAQMSDWFDEEANFTANTDWYATLRGCFGINSGPALIYFTAGGAWVHLTDGFPPGISALVAMLQPGPQVAGRSAAVPKWRSMRTGRRVWSFSIWMLATRPTSFFRRRPRSVLNSRTASRSCAPG